MRMKTYSRVLRILSAAVLFFFVWTFLPLWQAAAWAAEPRMRNADFGMRNGKPEPATTGEQFEKALESIREKVGRAEEKSQKDQDVTTEVAELRAGRAEIESLDIELRKEFAATENRLKDAKLPQEILGRHYKFVKHYEDNLAELKANLDGHEKAQKAQNKVKAREYLKKTKAHLEKTKPPRKHVPLDPNKLPFRTVKGKERAPRLKKEEFEREFGPQKHQGTKTADLSADLRRLTQIFTASGINSAWSLPSNVVIGGNPQSALTNKPILVAANGPLTGLLSSNSDLANPQPVIHEWNSSVSSAVNEFDFTPQSAIRNPQLLVAQTTVDLPTPADLSETPEVQFTPEIRAKAQDELGCNPTKIFNWVRNNIFYEAYYGSFKSAEQTLLEGAGNDFDQASLLISLMRVCNIAAKYAYGTVEIPAEKAANMVGVSDPRAAATIYSTQGIPVKLIVAGGTVEAIQMERAWVEAWIDYFPSWGARHKPGGEDTWISLDPSFKQYSYKQGMDMYAQMGFNAEQFLQEYITDTRDITAYQDYSIRLINFLETNYPNATVEDVLGASEIKQTKSIEKQEFPYLLGTLPYKVIVKAAQFAEVPQSKDYTITIQIEGDTLDGITGLTYRGGLNDLASKRITVSYDPATSTDEALIAQYGGNIFSVPPYLLNVKPVLRISGALAATGGPISMGKDQTIIISFTGPDGDVDRIQNIITAGAYSAIILQSQETPIDTPSQNMAMLIENSKRVENPDITLDDLLGQMLYSIGIFYFHNLMFESELYAKTLQVVCLRQPSEAIVTYGVTVDYVFGLPRSLSEGNINIDVDRSISSIYSPGQDKERKKAFMVLSGISSSVWESRIIEAFFDVPSVSAVRLLKLASEQGIPLYTVTNDNLNEILSQLIIESDIVTEIKNSVNIGKQVIISKTNLTYNEWTGVGYIAIDPATGAAGYMISGGLAGGNSSRRPQNSWHTRYDFVNAMLSPVQRRLVVDYAITKLWTPYDFGCVDGGLDCSGLTYKAYRFVGIKDFPRGARYQRSYVSQRYGFTDEPLFGDLVFFHGTYDANRDGVVDERDISHVGIYVNSTTYIAAQRSRGTNFYLFDIASPNGAWAADHFDSYGIVIP